MRILHVEYEQWEKMNREDRKCLYQNPLELVFFVVMNNDLVMLVVVCLLPQNDAVPGVVHRRQNSW